MNKKTTIEYYKDLVKTVKKKGVCELFPIADFDSIYLPSYVRLACIKKGYKRKIVHRRGIDMLIVYNY